MLIASALLLLQAQTAPPPLPAMQREFRAAWVATVDNIDWPSRKGLSTVEAKRELLNIIDQADKANLNALVFQVRPMADAFYVSKTEPWSEFLSGTQGKGPNPTWDPLAFTVEECHRRGMELHAWFNPYRAWHSVAKSPPDKRHVTVSRRGIVRQYGKQKWLDPGDPQAEKYALEAIFDVVRRYDVDGVHIDDYFYPYPVKGQAFPDDATYKRYGKGQSRAAWRRQNVDRFVEKMYKGVKAEKPWVKVGISPFGIYRPGVPKGIEASLDQYSDLYADPKKWLQKGWCDYFTPQLYWSIQPAKQSFPVILNWWADQNTQNRHLWPGVAAYKMVEGPKWGPEELVRQVEATRQAPMATGHVFFSAKYLVRNDKGIVTQLQSAYDGRALIPASPWIDSKRPATPKMLANSGEFSSGRVEVWNLRWTSAEPDVNGYFVRFGWPGAWGPPLFASEPLYTLVGRNTPGGMPSWVSIYAQDRAGNLSEPLVLAAPTR